MVFSFLLAKEKGTSRPVAFVSYRYDIDEGDEVVYWYAKYLIYVHMHSLCFGLFTATRSSLNQKFVEKGLFGKFLMQILELIGHRYIIIMLLSDQRKRFDKSSSEVIKFSLVIQ